MRQTHPAFPDRGAQSKKLRTSSSCTGTISRILSREKRLRLLVSELGHRTKNLLAIVQAIATQTADRSGDLEAFRPAFSQRIGALSRSLDLLIDEGEPGVSLAELVQRQLEPFVAVDGARIVVSGPCAPLNQQATQNLGLALHELATNATKYGALSVPDGSISVRWSLAPGPAGSDRFRLIWREHGGPPVAPPARNGFGSIVLQRIAAATLGGTVEHDFDAGGVSWTLDTAASSVLSGRARPADEAGA